MSPHYDRNFINLQESLVTDDDIAALDGSAVIDAAQALREMEIQSAQPTGAAAVNATAEDVDAMSIDELRQVATSLNVPNRAQVVSSDELVASIRARS